MAAFEIDFKWWKDEGGYDLAPAQKRSGGRRFDIPPVLVRKSTRLIEYEPLRDYPNLWLGVADESATPEGARRLATQFGLLGNWFVASSKKKRVDEYDGEPVDHWIHLIEKTQEIREVSAQGALDKHWAREEGLAISDLDAVVVPGTSLGELAIRFRPKNLASAVRLQMAQHLTSGADVSACDHCGNWFVVGGIQGRKKGAKTCSQRCHVAFNNAKRQRKGS